MTGVELKTGAKGVYKATVDDEVIYDKSVMGRKPEAGEIGRLAEGVLGPRIRWRKDKAIA